MNFLPIMKPRSGSGGFTLVELLVVIAIISVLAVLGFGNYVNSIRRSRDASRKSDLGNMVSALRLYYNDRGAYPCGNGSFQMLGCPANPPRNTACNWGTDLFGYGSDVFTPQLPKDPQSAVNQYRYYSVPAAASCTPGTGATQFMVGAFLEAADDPGIKASQAKCATVAASVGVSFTGALANMYVVCAY